MAATASASKPTIIRAGIAMVSSRTRATLASGLLDARAGLSHYPPIAAESEARRSPVVRQRK